MGRSYAVWIAASIPIVRDGAQSVLRLVTIVGRHLDAAVHQLIDERVTQ